MIHFTIPLMPEPKQGDRQRIARTKDGREFIAHYQPKQKAEKQIMELAAFHRPKKPLKGPLIIDIQFRFPWLKGHSKKDKSGAFKWKDTKPDLDNLEKLLLDALQKCGFFANDSQICRKISEKMWTDQCGIDVVIGELT